MTPSSIQPRDLPAAGGAGPLGTRPAVPRAKGAH